MTDVNDVVDSWLRQHPGWLTHDSNWYVDKCEATARSLAVMLTAAGIPAGVCIGKILNYDDLGWITTTSPAITQRISSRKRIGHAVTHIFDTKQCIDLTVRQFNPLIEVEYLSLETFRKRWQTVLMVN